MSVRIIENREALILRTRAIMSSLDNNAYMHRLEIVSLVLHGVPVSTLVEAGIGSKSSITDWVKTAVEKGPEALAPKEIPGRPRTLSEEQVSTLKEAVSRPASESGYDIWEGKTVSDYIKKTFSVDLGVRQCQRLMHMMGFSLQRPQTIPGGKVTAEEREDFKKSPNEARRPRLRGVFRG